MLTLITNSAHIMLENQAVKKQAENMSRAATQLLDNAAKESDKRTAEEKSNEELEASNDAHLENLKVKETEIRSLNDALKSAKADLEAMKKQAESVSREYDNLLKEHAKTTAKLEKYVYNEGAETHSGDWKKDN